MEGKLAAIDLEGYSKQFIQIVQKVIKNPAEFYREMPRSGGFVEPLVFAICMGVVAGLVRAVFGILGLEFAETFFMAIASIVIVPIFVVIFSFIGAGILFLIWKAMGSQEEYEVSFRCMAYAAAISPITSVLHIIPYLGPILGLVWMAYLLVNASVEVHKIELKKAWIVFGAICAVFAFISVSSQLAARSVQHNLENMNKQLGDINKMSPEEAGQKMGEFLKGLEKGAGKK